MKIIQQVTFPFHYKLFVKKLTFDIIIIMYIKLRKKNLAKELKLTNVIVSFIAAQN